MPAPDALTILVSQTPDEAVLMVEGELDAHTAPLLLRRLEEVHHDGASAVALDLSGVTFIDSSGLRVLINTAKELKATGDSLVIRSPSTIVRKLFELTRLESAFTVEDD